MRGHPSREEIADIDLVGRDFERGTYISFTPTFKCLGTIISWDLRESIDVQLSLKFPFPSSPLEAQNGKESGENRGKQGKMAVLKAGKHVPPGNSGEFPGKIKLRCSGPC